MDTKERPWAPWLLVDSDPSRRRLSVRNANSQLADSGWQCDFRSNVQLGPYRTISASAIADLEDAVSFANASKFEVHGRPATARASLVRKSPNDRFL